MILGQSAGAAASLAARTEIPIQKIPYLELKDVLEKAHQILSIPDDWREIILTAEAPH